MWVHLTSEGWSSLHASMSSKGVLHGLQPPCIPSTAAALGIGGDVQVPGHAIEVSADNQLPVLGKSGEEVVEKECLALP